ncbi:MAG: hypothetical protein IKX70_06560 [Treponema sp.]|nr:hypothetical protein [Treponema sp.]
MKKREMFIKKSLISSLILVLFFSCATTNETTKKSADSNASQEETVPQLSEEELFIQEMNKYTLEFTNVPAKIKKGKSFASDFEVTVKDENGNPAADFDVCFTYPAMKDGSKLVSTSIVVKTNENGIASFNPGIISFAVKSKIKAFPDITGKLESYYDVLPVPVTTADFLVESDVSSKGAIMFVFEFTEGGKPSKNSYEILSALRKKGGSMISNGPISDDTSYITASKQKIYKDNYEYVEDQFGYLIGGTVKFANPVETNEDGTYTAHLIAEIYGIDMKTGEVIYEETNEYTSTGTNWSKAVESCKEKLTAIVVDSIMYGL